MYTSLNSFTDKAKTTTQDEKKNVPFIYIHMNPKW